MRFHDDAQHRHMEVGVVSALQDYSAGYADWDKVRNAFVSGWAFQYKQEHCIVRVNSVFSKIFYVMCMFSMAVPFQMLMFTLSSTAYKLGLDKPWTIPIVYLGCGAGMSIFMFAGFVRSIPYDIEEAAIIDGCGPVRTFFLVVFPMMMPIAVSVGILELMWIWNDYLLPYLVLDITEYRTIPIHVQYLKGSYGSVDLGASLAVIVMSLLPIVIVYVLCQKCIVKGIAAGAAKG